jgi:type 2 lantibiotic biosynthesis protein LanM
MSGEIASPTATSRAWNGASDGAVGRASEAIDREAVLADELLGADPPLPFQEVFIPLVARARGTVRSRCGKAYRNLSVEAHRSLERSLLGRLTAVVGRALHAEFSARRTMQVNAMRVALARAFGSEPPHDCYDGFVAELLDGGMAGVWSRYPVAARLCGTLTTLWADTTAEFLTRLDEDRGTLHAAFGQSAPLGPVLDADAAGDSHDGGRQVLILTFECGTKVVYKPRPVALDALLYDLVECLNTHGPVRRLRAVRAIDRVAYGWLEFVEHSTCSTEAEVERFYERMGAFVALVFALGGTDFHMENLIAAGEHPVLLDAEALLSPLPRFDDLPGEESEAGVHAQRVLAESVLRTALLPQTQRTGHDTYLNVGGLGDFSEDGMTVSVPLWRDVNTDAMGLKPGEVALSSEEAHLPAPEGWGVTPGDYEDAILRGFEDGYRLLSRARRQLLGPSGLFARVADRPVRSILRDTRVYASLLMRTQHPSFQRNGVARSIELDVLSRPLLSETTEGRPPRMWPALAAEHEALDQGDVPLFSALAGGVDLLMPNDEKIENFFERSALEQADLRLAALSRTDMARQCEVIRMALRAHGRRGMTRPPAQGAGGSRPGAETGEPSSGVDLALSIAREVAAKAIWSPNGEAVTWFVPAYDAESGRFNVRCTDFNLLDGYGGVAVFFAALDRVASDEFAAVTSTLVRQLQASLGQLERDQALVRRAGFGVCAGLGGLVFTFGILSSLRGDPALLECASRTARLMYPGGGTADLGVATGAAGAVLGLLSLYDLTGDDDVLEIGRRFGDALLTCQQTNDGHAAPKSTAFDRTGYADGLAGIADALCRLHAQTGEEAYLTGALAALGKERAFPDYMGSWLSEPWARGPLGIGLGRLSALDADDDVAAELELAWEGSPDPSLGVLAGGLAGRVQFGDACRLALGSSAVGARRLPSRSVEGMRLRRLVERLGACASDWGPDLTHIGLLTGMTGTGYELLRMEWPDVLPHILRWTAGDPGR